MILARPISWTHLSKLSNRKTVGLHTDVPLLVPKFTFWCAVSLLEWMNIISKKLKAAKPSRLHRKVVLNMTEILCLLWECRTSNDNDIYFVQQDESAVHTERNSAIELKHKHTHTHTHIYIYIYIYICVYIYYSIFCLYNAHSYMFRHICIIRSTRQTNTQATIPREWPITKSRLYMQALKHSTITR
jgi:hypothetical protein